MKKKILALILAAVVFNTGIYYPADSYAYEGVDAVSAQMEDGTTGKNSEQASDHTETQDLQNPQEKDHQVLAQEQDAQDSSLNSDQQNQDGQESDDGSQIQPVSEEQDQETGIETEVETQAEKTSVSYRTHVQTYGWQDYVKDGETSGTSGQSKRLEGIQIKLEHPEYTGDIEYRTHVQTYGWQNYVKNDAMAGTTGQSKRLEAIQIRLTGEIAQHYDIYYRVHSQTYGWLDWAKNGEYAGTAGYSKRLEAIEIRLVEKGDAAPGATDKKYLHPMVSYRTHVQTYGWQGYVQDGTVAGTSGQSKRLEGIQIQLNNQEYDGNIEYRTHVQTYGWQGYVKNGAMSGTSGQSKRLEAIQIRLTGEMAQHYDIYYRVHSQTYGWLGWAKNGEYAGTAGYSKRLEAIQIQLYPKNASNAPAQTTRSYIANTEAGTLTYASFVEGSGWQNAVSAGTISGTTGQGKQLEAVKINLENVKDGLKGGIQYSACLETGGWQNWVNGGAVAGVTDHSSRIEAMKVQLTGEYASYYDVYYQVHLEKYGWLGWAKNGQIAGSTGIHYNMQAIKIVLLPKGSSAPGSTANPYTQSIYRPNRGISNALGISAAAVVMNLQSHEKDKFYLGTRYEPDLDYRSPNGDISFNGAPGMNCTGFVWYVLKSAGATPSAIPNQQEYSQCAGGWITWQRKYANQVPMYDFRSKSAMLNSGILEKGDVIWIWNENEGGKHGNSDYNHVGFFWGETSSQDLFWHSSPNGGNQISPITGLSNNVSYTVMKL